MNWDDYRYFLSVARTGQLSLAGKQMGVDHATVYRRIKSLEKSLQTKLFDSSPSGYQLTNDGLELLPIVEQMESTAIIAEGAVNTPQNELTGTVRVGATEGVASYIIVKAAKTLCEQHPKLNIQIAAMPRQFSLSKREVDFAISVSPPGPGRAKTRKISDYYLHLYATQDYLQNAPAIKSASDLKDHPGIGYVPELLHDKQLDYMPSIDPNFKLRLTSTSIHVQLQAILAGAGIGIVHDFMAIHHNELEPILKEQISIKRSFWLTIHEDYANIERIRLCADTIVNEVKKGVKL